jgi:mannose-6-phosphate isomerase-like protein (cupin superfamily)
MYIDALRIHQSGVYWRGVILKGNFMKGYIVNLEQETLDNSLYRKVLFTSHYSQLVLMCLRSGEEIGEEVHGLDQFIRIEQGNGKVVLDNEEAPVEKDYGIVISAGTKHNIINTSDTVDLKLYTVYSPPNHLDGTIHKTKADETEEHFDGKISM